MWSCLDKPVFVLTGDFDWAPDWALGRLLDIVEDGSLPLHLFVTHDSDLLPRRSSDAVTLGIHPNFMNGSSHGEEPDEVIDTCMSLVPGANTFRAHSLYENNHVLLMLARKGFIADSNLLAFLQPRLTPIIQGAGMLRFPIFFEDDVFLWWSDSDLDLSLVMRLLFEPGLKIFNFHPALVAINAPSVAYYNEQRAKLFEGKGEAIRPYPGRGVATLLQEIVAAVYDAGFSFTPFPNVVDDGWASVRQAFPDGLYGWSQVPRAEIGY